MIDWYNYIVQHNPTPVGFKTGRGAAYETPLRDKVHGRIYRIVYHDAPPAKPPALDPAMRRGSWLLSRATTSSGGCTRSGCWSSAAKTDVVPALVELVRDRSVDAIGLNAGAIHALWTLHGLGALGQSEGEAALAATAALAHPSPGVRRNAVQVLPGDGRSAAAIASSGLLRDPDAHVRLAAFLAVADQPASEPVATAVAAALKAGVVQGDVWLIDAATAAAARNDAAFLKVIAARSEGRPAGAEVIRITDRVAEHWARGGPSDQIAALLAGLRGGEPAVTEAILRGLARGWPSGRAGRRSIAPAKKRSNDCRRSCRQRRAVSSSGWWAGGETRRSIDWAPRSPRPFRRGA